jgi:diguanylate cyclase (GGDEF)-like protein
MARQARQLNGESPAEFLSGPYRHLDWVPQAVAALDADDRLLFGNRRFFTLTGGSPRTALGKPWRTLLRLTHPDHPEQPVTHLPTGTEVNAPGGGDLLVLARHDGAERAVEAQVTPPWPGDAGDVERLLWIRDCTEAHERMRALERQSRQDYLTNLVNRREFERRVEQAAEQARTGWAEHLLVFIDLDGFKQVNDTLGHIAGDEILRQVAEVLRDTVRERDTASRFGGDEFGLLMEHCRPVEGLRAVEAIRVAVRNRKFVWQQHTVRLQASIGVARINPLMHDAQMALHQADSACYAVKSGGGDGVQLHESGPLARAEARANAAACPPRTQQ